MECFPMCLCLLSLMGKASKISLWFLTAGWFEIEFCHPSTQHARSMKLNSGWIQNPRHNSGVICNAVRSMKKDTKLYWKIRQTCWTICSKFTGEQLCTSVISITLVCSFTEIILLHDYSAVYLLDFCRTNFFEEHLWGTASEFVML